MKSISLLCALAVIGFTPLSYAQSWSLEYGTNNGQVAYYNAKNTPDFAEDQPFGPMSFRVINNKLWVLDSIAGKLTHFDEKGLPQKSIVVPGLEGFNLLEDFALVGKDLNSPEFVWIANAADSLIKKISVDEGKVIATIGGNGQEQGKVLQVNQLEVDSKGQLYVADIAKNMLSIFSPEGNFLREMPWQNSGLAIDSKDNLHVLFFHDNFGYAHQVYSKDGQLIANTHLGLNDNQNAKIIKANEDGSIILSLIPEGGFKGVMSVYKINMHGAIEEKLSYVPPSPMNRYLSVDNGKVYAVEADYETAPDTKYLVNPLNWEVKKNNSQSETKTEG